MSDLKTKTQSGLDETRILVLGGQVLIGFQFRSVFEKGFEKLPSATQEAKLVGLGLMLVALALLILPSAYHRIVEEGEDTEEFHQFITRAAAPALLPFTAGLGIDLFVAGERLFGRAIGIALGAAAAAIALWFWYGLEAVARWRRGARPVEEINNVNHEKGGEDAAQKTAERVRQVLTETRVVLPGAQALLGFQFATFLMEGFEKLPEPAQWTHLAALATVAVSTILLMMPAAYHRIVEEGESTEHFHRFTSRALLAAMAFLALGISADFGVVLLKATHSLNAAVWGALGSLILFFGTWFGFTLFQRQEKRRSKARQAIPAQAAPR